MVLICFFQVISNIEYLFICLLAICVSFGGKISIQVLCPFLIRLFVVCVCVCVCVLSCMSSLSILDINSLSDIPLVVSSIHKDALSLLMVFFAVQKLLLFFFLKILFIYS